jgi:predicted membrane channel-forming protein YqfA (hemolysin III family)
MLTWAVPRWSYVPRLWRGLYVIVNSRSLVRIAGASIVGCVAFVGAFKILIPNLAVGNLWLMVFALPGILLALVAQMAIHTAIPPFVSVRKDRVLYSHGQSNFALKADQIESIHLTVFGNSKIRLKIRYTRSRRTRLLRIGVSPKIDLMLLAETLPIAPIVNDARSRR